MLYDEIREKVNRLAEELGIMIAEEKLVLVTDGDVMESVVTTLLDNVYESDRSKARFLHKMVGKYL